MPAKTAVRKIVRIDESKFNGCGLCVPCCTGIVHAVREALDRAGRTDIPLHDVTVGIEGGIPART